MTIVTVPRASSEGLYECTGLGEDTKYFTKGQIMEPGGCRECQDGSAVWLFCPSESVDEEDLLEVSIDLDCLPEGLYIKVEDLFQPGDVINLKILLDTNFTGLSDGAYRILSGEEEGASFHFAAEKIGHKYWQPNAPLYHARPHP